MMGENWHEIAFLSDLMTMIYMNGLMQKGSEDIRKSHTLKVPFYMSRFIH